LCDFTGKDAYELRQLSKQRTENFDEKYIREVCQIWDLVKARPPPHVVIESRWEICDKRIVCRSLAQEYYLSLLHWVLSEKKELARACRVVQWKMLPCAKIIKTSPVYFMSENGCRQLLCFTLVRLMVSLVFKSEARESTGNMFCGMIQWILNQTHLLIQLKSPFEVEARQIKLEMRAMLLLYVAPDNSDHGIQLAMEAMNAFLLLKDTVRYEKAKSRVPATSVLIPTTTHRVISPIGPSSISSLNNNKIF
jgi:hypothetical protein